MNALLLSAGYGKRLWPLTKNKPKCLIDIFEGENLLNLWIKKLIKLNVKKIIVNTHFKDNLIRNFIKQSKYKKKIQISYEKKILGTAGTLFKHKNLLKNNDLILIHSDNYCEDSLVKFLKAHQSRPKNCMISMLTFRTDNPKSCGIVKVDKKKIVKEFHEKKNYYKGNLANGAIYVISKKIYSDLKNKKYFDFSKEVIPQYLNRIMSHETKSFYIDIGTPKNLKKTKKYLNEKYNKKNN